jgi:hypothetical protein
LLLLILLIFVRIVMLFKQARIHTLTLAVTVVTDVTSALILVRDPTRAVVVRVILRSIVNWAIQRTRLVAVFLVVLQVPAYLAQITRIWVIYPNRFLLSNGRCLL